MFAHRTVRFTGTVPADQATPGVRPAGKADLDAVADYDRACHPADRPRFLEHWLTARGHRVLVRLDGDRLTGYGVIRPARVGLRVGPLFADTADDAGALLAAFAAEAAGRELAVDVPETNSAGVALAERSGLTPPSRRPACTRGRSGPSRGSGCTG